MAPLAPLDDQGDDLGIPIQLITWHMRSTDVIMCVTLVGKLNKVDVELLQLYITPHLYKPSSRECARGGASITTINLIRGKASAQNDPQLLDSDIYIVITDAQHPVFSDSTTYKCRQHIWQSPPSDDPLVTRLGVSRSGRSSTGCYRSKYGRDFEESLPVMSSAPIYLPFSYWASQQRLMTSLCFLYAHNVLRVLQANKLSVRL
jgi:hypothetical protein